MSGYPYETGITELDIVEKRERIELRLHAAYLNLTDQMTEFRGQWDASPAAAYATSAREGWNAGGAGWLDGQVELFNVELWADLGRKMRVAAGSQRATASEQASGTPGQGENNSPDDWAWWQRSIPETASGREDAGDVLQSAGPTVIAGEEQARELYQHRDAILNLQNLIADGKPQPLHKFLDAVLMNIDSALAESIRGDPNFDLVLAIVADDGNVLSYLAYVGLMTEAIPPNFYAYVAGKGGAYLMLEVSMLTVCTLLSGGTEAADRITTLIGRLTEAEEEIDIANDAIERGAAAIDVFIRMLEDLSDSVDEIHTFGARLAQARSEGLTVRGSADTTLAAKRTSVKQDEKCRACGSVTHTTPRHRPGNVEYD